MTPKFQFGRNFCTTHPPPSFIILCLLVRKVSCWQTHTHTHTHKQSNRRRWKHPTLFATLRRWVMMPSDPESQAQLAVAVTSWSIPRYRWSDICQGISSHLRVVQNMCNCPTSAVGKRMHIRNGKVKAKTKQSKVYQLLVISSMLWEITCHMGSHSVTRHPATHPTPSFIILCLLVRKVSCWQTHTHPQTNKQTPMKTTLRRWVMMPSDPESQAQLAGQGTIITIITIIITGDK